MLTAAERFRGDAGQGEHARGGGGDAVRQQLRVVEDRRLRSRERSHDRNRPAAGTAGRVERELRGVAEPFDARPVLIPLGQALRPPCSLGLPKCLRGQSGPARLVLVHPGRELRR